MNNKKIIFLPLFLILLTGNIFGQLIDKPAASINYSKPEMISVKQLEAQVQVVNALRERAGQQAKQPTIADKVEVLEMMISDMLIMQAAESKGIKAEEAEIANAINSQKVQLEQQNQRKITDVQFRAAIESQTGYTWVKYREQLSKQIIQQKFLMSEKQAEIESYVKMPDFSEIERVFKQNRTQFSNPEMARYSQIFISTLNLDYSKVQEAEKKADEAYRKYVNGSASFEQLVNDYTEDPNAKYRNGDSGYIAYNDPNVSAYLGKNFIDQLFSIKEGDVKGVIKSNIGYHIIKITDYREAKLLTLDDTIHPTASQTVREFIAQQLIVSSQNAAVSKSLNELVEELKKDADIKIFEDNIN
ncbi:MAG: peptidylprolyl isomerase [Spirochaetales bacterium]|nr:peptidylprolyl isomerase [Spirochaetales bacterium]